MIVVVDILRIYPSDVPFVANPNYHSFNSDVTADWKLVIVVKRSSYGTIADRANSVKLAHCARFRLAAVAVIELAADVEAFSVADAVANHHRITVAAFVFAVAAIPVAVGVIADFMPIAVPVA